MTEPHIPSASGQAGYMAEFPTRYPLSPSHRGAGSRSRTHSIVTVYPAYTFKSDTTAPRGQPQLLIARRVHTSRPFLPLPLDHSACSLAVNDCEVRVLNLEVARPPNSGNHLGFRGKLHRINYLTVQTALHAKPPPWTGWQLLQLYIFRMTILLFNWFEPVYILPRVLVT